MAGGGEIEETMAADKQAIHKLEKLKSRLSKEVKLYKTVFGVEARPSDAEMN